MDKEIKMVFKKKDGFIKEINYPSIPFEPIRKLVEYDDLSVSAKFNLNTTREPVLKERVFQAKKITTIIDYQEI